MMKSLLVKFLSLVCILGISASANADIREVWTCTIKDGKSMDDVRAANSSWVKFVNENVDGGGITSHIITSVVGNVTPRSFGYVDSFPTLESWAAARAATEGSEEGEAIEAALGDVADCSENRLYEAEAS